MKNFIFKKIDAFAAGASRGNPAGAIYLRPEEKISEHEMQRIARELKGFVNEVGYVRKINESVFDLKFYSSEKEVEFCGHATIAIMYDLFSNDAALCARDSATIITRRGESAIENRISSADSVFISAPEPVYSAQAVLRSDIAGALRLDAQGISSDLPVSVVNAGLQTLVVPIGKLADILAVNPEISTLRDFCISNSIDIITVFSSDTASQANAFRVRVFAPVFGYLEDPATGSGNAALGYYLLKNGLWDGNPVSIEQNNSFDNPNIIKLFAKPDKNQMRVYFGGGAITRIAGNYCIY